MPIVDVGKVIQALRAHTPKGRVKMEVKVEYTAPYAIYVHEDLTAHHNVGQAKYLEQPARTEARKMQEMIMNAVRNKEGLEKGLKRAAQYLLDESRKLVPVDTGFLKESGFLQVIPLN